MASVIQISDIASDISFRLNIPALGADQFVTEAQALRLIQQALGRLMGILTRVYGDALFTSEDTITTIPGLDLQSLPADFVTMVSLHVRLGGNAYELRRSDLGDLGWTESPWSPTRLPTYRIEGRVLRLYPTPDAAYDLIIRYTNGLTVSSLTDMILGEPNWADFIVADVCARIRQREQKDASEFIRERMEVEAQIVDQAAQRDRGGVYTVRDTAGALKSRSPRCWWRY